MKPKPLSTIDKRRPSLAHRPRLGSTMYDRLTRDGIMHADIYAYAGDGYAYFAIEYRWAGKAMMARDWARFDGETLEVCDAPLTHWALAQRYWHAGNNATLGRVHGALVDRARRVAGDALLALHGAGGAVSVLCHYAPALHGTPWPRGWQNRYGTGARTGLIEKSD